MSYQQVQLSTLKEMAQNRLGNRAFYTPGEVVFLINEALRIWNLLTHEWHGTDTLITTANGIYYNISGLALHAMRVEFGSTPLDQTSLFSLDQGKPGWQFDRSVPREWFPVGLTKIGIHPAHQAGGGTLRIEGLLSTPVLVADDDFLNLGLWHIQAIMDYVHHAASFKQGGQEFADSMGMLRNFVRLAGIQSSKFLNNAMYRKYMGQDLDEMLRRAYDSEPVAAGDQE